MPGIDPPSKQFFASAALALVKEFEPKKLVYLDPCGNWKENPETLFQRAQHEFLFRIWRLDGNRRKSFFQFISKFFLDRSHWFLSKTLSFALFSSGLHETSLQKEEDIDERLFAAFSQRREKKFLAAFVALQSISCILQLQTLRFLKDTKVVQWDGEGIALKREAESEYKNMRALLHRITGDTGLAEFENELFAALKQGDANLLSSILDVLSAEERLRQTFSRLLESAEDEKKREEAFQWILEKMTPPQGIVTETSPALFRPCLNFLLDPRIELTSGIPYQSSVILSILKDPRSTASLLEALNRFPVHCTKIRENTIYTLGNLREKEAVQPLSEVLGLPDKTTITSPGGQPSIVHLFEQKEEAIWALGKIGYPATAALQALLKIKDHPSAKLKTNLAWTLGEIGRAEKVIRGGVSADILIALLELLKTRDKRLFEETVSALKKIRLPEFIHALYLYNVGAVNLLALTPAQKGLFELSETIHFLIETKGSAVVAVNGDSGTGKTYFCQSLIDGFGDVNPDEILYLMRDRKKDQRIFNRMLGQKWLKSRVDPIHYQDDFLSEDEDAPEEYFLRFLENHGDKKLILLDGCRDEAYFQRVIELFYIHGKLDVEVNFRATHSTRRLNLEEREVAIESVKTHLAFLQEPPLEDTVFYLEGNTILYDLDNSFFSRLSREEIRKLFQKKRIDGWGDLILLGEFKKERHPLKPVNGQLRLVHERFRTESETWQEAKAKPLQSEEKKFSPGLNPDLKGKPNLIMEIQTSDIQPRQLRFYAQDQIAGIGEGGSIFIVTLLDNRIFYSFQEPMKAMSLFGRDFLLLNGKGEVFSLSFEKNELLRLEGTHSPVNALAALPNEGAITGHMDGSIRIWDLIHKRLQKLKAHSGPVASLAADHWGHIYSVGQDFFLKRWDMAEGTVSEVLLPEERIVRITPYPGEKILAFSDSAAIHILDLKNAEKISMSAPFSGPLLGGNPTRDGRFTAIVKEAGKRPSRPGSLPAFFSPSEDGFFFQILDGHHQQTYDCLPMGPRIITCGRDSAKKHSIRIWGTDYQARTARAKLEILSG